MSFGFKLGAPLPWPVLTHPDDRSAVAAKPPTKTPKSAGVKRRHKRDMRDDPMMISKLLHYVVHSLGVDSPELYLLEDRKGPMFEVITLQDGKRHGPALLCRPELLQGMNVHEIAFLAAVDLTALRDLGPLEKTARRAGLLICGDLEVAKRLTPASAHADLVALWTSDEHRPLRQQLRLSGP